MHKLTCRHNSMLFFTLYFQNLKKKNPDFQIKTFLHKVVYLVFLNLGSDAACSFFQVITLLFYFPAFLSGVSPMRMLYIEDIAPNIEQLARVQLLNSVCHLLSWS